MLLLLSKQFIKSTYGTGLIRRGFKTAGGTDVVFSNGFVRMISQIMTFKSKFYHSLFDHLSRVLNLSFGKLSRLADGSSVAKFGETNVMVTAVSQDKLSKSNFMPLTVDYREKASAGGRIPTNHLRRDLAPTDREILSSRLIDRSIRNSFPAGYFYDTQIACNVLSIDAVNDPDIIAINAACTALSLSNIPWNGPVGAIRISCLNDELIVNPNKKEIANSDFSIVVTSNLDGRIIMLEGSGRRVLSNDRILAMINLAIEQNRLIINAINQLKSEHQVPKREVEKYFQPTDKQIDDALLISKVRLKEILSDSSFDKKERDQHLQKLRAEIVDKLKESYPQEELSILNESFYKCLKDVYCDLVFETGIRCDGRREDEVRPLYSECDLYKPLHGSALFQRGQTQVLATLTFDSPDSALKLNNYGFPDEIKEKNFMLHYEFPPYSVNEIGRIGVYGRREVGHGSLAERSLKPIVPEDLPFVVRLTAEVLESNGSSSMASVCAGSLAMMDAGLDIKNHAAGVAIGLLKHSKNGEYKVLTDILGFEDYAGEMDFKISGTKNGLTALQLDCKLVDGLEQSILEKALNKAEQARNHILDHMNRTISVANSNKHNLPVIAKIEIPQHKRGSFLGLNGHNLKRLKAEIGVTITQDSDNSNTFNLFAPNQDAMNEAQEYIDEKLKEDQEVDLEFGAIYDAQIVEVKEGGVMVKIKGQPLIYLKNKHLDKRQIKHASSIGLGVGSVIQVKYFGRDPANGAIRLSRKVLQV